MLVESHLHPTSEPVASPSDLAETGPVGWHACRFLTCSVLPVRMACNLQCPFCFSKSSISSLRHESISWMPSELERYFAYSIERGANRLVITGGGEPLLREQEALRLVQAGKAYFDEIALFTNGSKMTGELATQLSDAGLSYVCYSRHHHDDVRCRDLMGSQAPALDTFLHAVWPLKVRATCVMTRGWIDSPSAAQEYINALSEYGVREFTFKHTYITYSQSMFSDSTANRWSRDHQIESDPFFGRGSVVSQLPWGPEIRQLGDCRVCYYFEPTPTWELENRLCRSVNLLSDGNVYASLEAQQSHLFQLNN